MGKLNKFLFFNFSSRPSEKCKKFRKYSGPEFYPEIYHRIIYFLVYTLDYLAPSGMGGGRLVESGEGLFPERKSS